MKKYFLLMAFFSTAVFAIPPCPTNMILITGYAQSFMADTPIVGATIKILQTGQTTTTDIFGNYGFCVPPESTVTLQLSKRDSIFSSDDFKTTQSGTFIVPATGYPIPLFGITFQVPTNTLYALLSLIIQEERGIQIDPTRCNVVTTVTQWGKTLWNDPQGAPGAKIELNPMANVDPFYFGMTPTGGTDPFTPNLTQTSLDGGVLIYNLPPNHYTLNAADPGILMTEATFDCTPGAFINISPPQGPHPISW